MTDQMNAAGVPIQLALALAMLLNVSRVEAVSDFVELINYAALRARLRPLEALLAGWARLF